MLSCQALRCGRRRMPWTCRCTASPEDGEQTSSKLDTGAALSPLATSAFPCLVLRVPRDQSDRPYDATIKRPNIQGRSRETKTSNSEARESHRSIYPPGSAPRIETFSRLRRQEARVARARLSLPERAHRLRGTPATGGSRSAVVAAGDSMGRRTWMGRAGASHHPAAFLCSATERQREFKHATVCPRLSLCATGTPPSGGGNAWRGGASPSRNRSLLRREEGTELAF